MGKWNNSYNNNRHYNKNWEKQFNWLTWRNNYCMCKICNSTLTNLRRSGFLAHEKSVKHRKNMEKCLISNNYCSRLEINDTKIFDSCEEIDQSLTDFQIESPSHNLSPPPKKLMIKSLGIDTKALEDTIGNFYKTINTSSEVSSSNFEDSDETFGRYLGKELKNIKNISLKKKLKLKIMNMILNTDDSADENSSLHPFPIFVSTSQNITFPKVMNSSQVSNDES